MLLVHKPSAVGMSWPSEIPRKNDRLKARMLSFNPLVFGERRPGKLNLAVLVGEITRIENAEPALFQQQEVEDIQIADKRLANVVHLAPLIFAVRIAYESADTARERLGREVQKFARWAAPNGMEFSLQEHTWQLPYGPTQEHLSPTARHLLFDDGEAIAICLAWHWLNGHGKGLLALDHETAETQDVWGAKICCEH